MTSNNSGNHEISSLNLKKIDYDDKAKTKFLYGFNIQTEKHFKNQDPLGKESLRCENIRRITFGLGSLGR